MSTAADVVHETARRAFLARVDQPYEDLRAEIITERDLRIALAIREALDLVVVALADPDDANRVAAIWSVLEDLRAGCTRIQADAENRWHDARKARDGDRKPFNWAAGSAA